MPAQRPMAAGLGRPRCSTPTTGPAFLRSSARTPGGGAWRPVRRPRLLGVLAWAVERLSLRCLLPVGCSLLIILALTGRRHAAESEQPASRLTSGCSRANLLIAV